MDRFLTALKIMFLNFCITFIFFYLIWEWYVFTLLLLWLVISFEWWIFMQLVLGAVSSFFSSVIYLSILMFHSLLFKNILKLRNSKFFLITSSVLFVVSFDKLDKRWSFLDNSGLYSLYFNLALIYFFFIGFYFLFLKWREKK